jgi:nitrilase
VISSDGLLLSRGLDEKILSAELGLGRLSGEFQHFDAVGHYNRPDVFSFSVDRTPRSAVDWLG